MTDAAKSVRCACGAVEVEAQGPPIAGVVCYCDDCQTAAQQIEAMQNAPPFRGRDGGTPLIVYRKDRMRYVRGRDRLQRIKLSEGSATNRWVASCCNSAMMLDFDDGKHWVDIYRARFVRDPPPIEMRVCTKFATGGIDNPEGLPVARRYSVHFIARLIMARLAMVFA
jgi:hypothetical protein